MAQKKTLTPQSAADLTDTVRRGRESLHNVRSELIPYFTKDERLRKKIDRLFDDYEDFEKECGSELAKRTS